MQTLHKAFIIQKHTLHMATTIIIHKETNISLNDYIYNTYQSFLRKSSMQNSDFAFGNGSHFLLWKGVHFFINKCSMVAKILKKITNIE